MANRTSISILDSAILTPAIASIGMIIRKRPMNIASPSVVFQNGVLADKPANALPLFAVAEV